MNNSQIAIGYLADHRDFLPGIKKWFVEEWPDQYGEDGSGDIMAELLSGSIDSDLPISLVALDNGEPAAVIALQDDSVETHKHLGPWAGLLIVSPQYRKKGIGSILVSEIEDLATGMGFVKVYAGTNSANALLERRGWIAIDTGHCHLGAVTVYEKEL